ncbi:hypothetical protein PIB30_074002, partial [Stylosanthes scabra]|nr:hypothetical protein [Stylosanthes scabra]
MKKAMNQKENFLAEVHSRTPGWNFNLYVIRMWDVPTKYNPNELWYVEMILQDSKGERMHAVLPRSLLKRWGKVLKEFHLFNMRWFVVVEDKLKSKTTGTDIVLTFSNKTQVTPLTNPSFPLEALRLKPIGDLLQAERIDDAELFDVVALVVGREDPREMLTKQGKELKRLQIVVEDIDLGNGGAGASSRISHVSSRTAVSAVEELSQPNAQVMKIEDVVKCTEECKPWIAASIMGVNNGMHDWYKVEVMVYDGTACLNLLMWDTQVIQLCGKRADQVAKEDMEELGYPPTLDNLIQRNAMFKINVKRNNIDKDDQVYTVSNICEDDDLVKQHLPDDFTSHADGTVTEMGGSNSLGDSEAVANLQTDCHDYLHVDPAKRNVTEQTGGSGVDEAQLEGQLSTNKFSGRG